MNQFANGQTPGQQYVQSQQPQQGVQVLPDWGYQQYGTDHLPPPPQRGQQQMYQGQIPGQNLGVPPQQGVGVPGQQVQQPVYNPGPQFAPQQGYQPQPGYGLQPQQNGGAQFQQVGYQPQQYGQPPQAQRPQSLQLSDDTILDGPGVPENLRGRPWGQAKQYFNALAENWRQQQTREQPAQQTPPAQQRQGLPPQYSREPQQQPTQNFFQNPQQALREAVRQEIQESVMPALQPVVAQSQSTAIATAIQTARSGIADYAQLEPQVMETLRNVDPTMLQNPQTWINAARYVRGQLMESGQYQAQQPQIPGRQQPGYGPGVSVPAQPQPYQYFTEHPTAPQAYTQGGMPQPTREEVVSAARFGIPVEEFMAWKLGVPNGQPVGV